MKKERRRRSFLLSKLFLRKKSPLPVKVFSPPDRIQGESAPKELKP